MVYWPVASTSSGPVVLYWWGSNSIVPASHFSHTYSSEAGCSASTAHDADEQKNTIQEASMARIPYEISKHIFTNCCSLLYSFSTPPPHQLCCHLLLYFCRYTVGIVFIYVGILAGGIVIIIIIRAPRAVTIDRSSKRQWFGERTDACCLYMPSADPMRRPTHYSLRA